MMTETPPTKEPPCRKLRPIDMKPGQYVIVSEWKDEAGLPAYGSREWYELPQNQQIKKPIGDPLKVLALAFPYVTVEVCQNRTRGVLDTRLSDFILVDKTYVRSLVPSYFKAPKKPVETKEEPQRRFVMGQGWVEVPKGRRI